MPRKRVARRDRVGTGQVIAAPATTIVLSSGIIPLSIVAGASNTFDTDTVTISSTGNGAGFGFSDDAAWLTYTTVASPDGSVLLTPTVDGSALTAGSYTGTITVTDARASNTPQTITVSLAVTADVPVIGLLPQSLNFTLVDETVGAGQSVLISNASASSGALATPTVGVKSYNGVFTGWAGTSAVVDNLDGTFTVTVTPTAVGGTVGGPYTATIPIVSVGASNTPANITATLTVTATASALLTLDRTVDDFTRTTVGGANPSDVTVGLRSGNTTPLVGPAVGAPSYGGVHTGWATASISGNTLTVSADVSGLLVDGLGWVDFVVSDGAATNTVTYRTYLRLGAATALPALLSVTPSGASIGVPNGSDAPSQVLTVSNGGQGGLAGLGTVAAAFTTTTAWCTPSYNVNSGELTLVYTTSALANGTYNATLRVTSSLATNSPVDVPVQVIVSAVVVPGVYPDPPAAIVLPEGWTWPAGSGYPTGSCFDLVGPASAALGARPPFAGTTHNIPETYASWTAAMAAVTAGTIVPGDKISIRVDQTITDPQFPVIPGWSLGDEFICVQSRNIASLPAYSYASGPASYGVNNRGGKDAHLADMPKMKTTTVNRSVLNFQQGTGGWWIEAIDIWADTASVTQNVVSLTAMSGTSNTTQNQAAHVPTAIVIDRCRFRSSNSHLYTIGPADARYFRITHCTADLALKPGGNYESKFCYLINTDGKCDILGNDCPAWGIVLLIGGSEPNWKDINPSDGMFLWNRVALPSRTGLVDADDCKNFFENKNGRRWVCAFNSASGLANSSGQDCGYLGKAVDPANLVGGVCRVPQITVAAHVTDILYWCNRVYGAKGLGNIVDTYNPIPPNCGVGGAIGVERVCLGYNLVLNEWNTGLYPYGNSAPTDRPYLRTGQSAGDGIPGIYVIHNTVGSTDETTDRCMIELGVLALGAAWRDFYFDNNIMITRSNAYPFRGNTGQNTTAMNAVFGSGNWFARRNLIGNGSAGTWDATLLGAGYNNGYLISGSNFTDPANKDYSLKAAHPAKGTAFGSTRDPGYDHAYLTAMTSTVLSNAGL